MLDPKALQQLVEQQVQQEVADRVATALNEQRINVIEDNAIKFIQDRIVAKFANSEAMPELVEAVKSSVRELFHSGQIPGLGQYVDYDFIKQSVNNSTQELVQVAIKELTIDKHWLEKIETQINQHMIQRIVATLGSTDIRSMVNERVSEITESVIKKIMPGIQDQSHSVEMTVMDGNVVVENTLTARELTAVDTLTVKNLVVKGNVNTDNQSWNELANKISKTTLDKLTDQWKQTLIEQVAEHIAGQGIDFNTVLIDGQKVIDGSSLNNKITESNIQKVGTLRQLAVSGEAHITDTMSVIKNRVGINTNDPEMALSIWDEEVSIVAGKFKNKTAYLGTSRKQSLALGINKNPAIEIDENGLTAIKELQIGIHRVSHGSEVPNYSGTKGDVVFNAVPTVENPIFAWQCLGGFKWKIIKAVQ